MHAQYIRLRNLLLFVVGLTAYIVLAWSQTGSEVIYHLDHIDGRALLGIDDVYRYYISTLPLNSLELFSWSYVQPFALALDHSLNVITFDSLLYIRIIKVSLGYFSLYLLYCTLRKYGVGCKAAVLSVFLLGLMPLWPLVFISFYAEAWLALFVSLLLWGGATGRKSLVLACLACLPLLRPEGLFLLIPYSIYYLLLRDVKSFLLVYLPGFIYFCFLLLSLDDVSSFYAWRVELRYIVNVTLTQILPYSWHAVFMSFNLVWLAVGAFGAKLVYQKGHTGLLVLLIGSLLWVGWQVVSLSLGVASHEARYYFLILPIFTVSVGFSIDWMFKRIGTRRYLLIGVFGCCLCVACDHLLQLDFLRASLASGHRMITTYPVVFRDLKVGDSASRLEARKAANVIGNIVSRDNKITTVLVADYDLFYYLKKTGPLKSVSIELSPFNQEIYQFCCKSIYFSMSEVEGVSRYYRFRIARSDDDKRVLYAGPLRYQGLSPKYNGGEYQLYVLGFEYFDFDDTGLE